MKKLLFYTLAAFIGLPGFAQDNKALEFNIQGKINGKMTGYVYLFYPLGENYKTDSAAIKNGVFVFKGKLTEPVMASLAASRNSRNSDDPNMTSFFIEPGKMDMVVSYGAFKQLTLKGSPSNDELERLNKQKAPIRKEMEPVLEAYRKEKDHEKAAAIREQFEPFNERMDKIDEAFISTHPDSYISAYLMRFKMSSVALDKAKAIYNGWTDRIKQSGSGKDVYKEILELESGSPGSVARVFAKADINGEQLSLADFKGKKYVLIDFWASWCVPCRKGNPHLLSLYSKYKDKGLEIIGISDDDTNHAAWKKAVDQDKISVWKHVLRGLKRTATGYDKSEDITEGYGIHSLPTKILIDKNGIIVGRYGGGGEDDAAMDKKMAEIFNN
ncbi:TlpA disulfide reductase family protein [Pedobacter nyackensis]|uniref:Thiol-disulfide isomerase or thioredoxin n=1 Tax=Pedobacter nyackensis TaxID=475255 RepID=A0A1W2F5K4_9SPHI|nr:TlpA disulfide reductase family protein [Pedobacter nyackensis]SMD17211.1 Thiol-disulfide isomerase or thioredoxin [Pedobacter nyackensis]